MFAIIDEQSTIEGCTTIQASAGLQNIREVDMLISLSIQYKRKPL